MGSPSLSPKVKNMPMMLRFVIIYDGVEYAFNDPEGWDGTSTALSRGEYHGLNMEQSTDLMFSKEFYDLLRTIYKEKGVFAEVQLRIDRRTETWTWESEGTFYLDMTKYSDDFNEIKSQIIESSLRAKFNAKLDVDFDIDITPESAIFLNYEYPKTVTTNIIQGQVGSTVELYNNHFNFILGGLATSSYDSDFGFVKENFESYDYMMFRLKHDIDVTTPIQISYQIRVMIQAGKFPLAADMPDGIITMARFRSGSRDNDFREAEYYPTYVDVPDLGTDYYFDSDSEGNFIGEPTVYTADIWGLEGDEIALIFYQNYDGYLVRPRVATYPIGNGEDLKIISRKLSDNDPASNKLQCFSFDWLISQLLLKIDSNTTFVNNIVNENIMPLLSNADCFRNIGGAVINGIVTTNLKDALDAYNCIEAIGIDITGNTLTIDAVGNFYKDEQLEKVRSNKVVLSHDTRHVYNVIKVGTKCDDDTENGNFAFNCEKGFVIQDATTYKESKDNELNLVSPYQTDMYSINKKIKDLYGNTTDNDNNHSEICIFACHKEFIVVTDTIIVNTVSDEVHDGYVIAWLSSSPTTPPAHYIVSEISQLGTGFTKPENGFLKFTAPYTGRFHFKFSFRVHDTSLIPEEIRLNHACGINTALFEAGFTNSFAYSYAKLDLVYTFDGYINLNEAASFEFIPIITMINEIEDDHFIIIDIVVSMNADVNESIQLYKDTIVLSNFNGDSETAFNLPYSPKRILNKHLPYISISNVGNTLPLKFASSSIKTNITSQLAYETVSIEENADKATTGHLFLPVKCVFNTSARYDTIKALRARKYDYLEIEYRGKTIKGWVDKAASKIGKQQSQEWNLLVKEYDI